MWNKYAFLETEIHNTSAAHTLSALQKLSEKTAILL